MKIRLSLRLSFNRTLSSPPFVQDARPYLWTLVLIEDVRPRPARPGRSSSLLVASLVRPPLAEGVRPRSLSSPARNARSLPHGSPLAQDVRPPPCSSYIFFSHTLARP
ncbi:hypothetical protein LR48_Vigan10g192700 [Vigna angularis]|uniref:Uncharacterized protein n=1 Tax=Phaseolus angularis TaxID=3914 RepID=A0A0L9VLW6_PHAAN|nr:hypothetical protein LR48_Vigan10g192700 [Vigna angularis]